MKRAFDFIHARAEELRRRFRRPERLLALFVEDYEKRLSQARSSCALLVSDSKRLELAARDHERAAGDAMEAARQAMSEGRETEARVALLRKIEHEHARGRVIEELADLRRESEKMAGELAQLAGTVEEARRKQHRLLARRDLDRAQPAGSQEGAAGDVERSWDHERSTLPGDIDAAVDDEIERAFERLEREEKLRGEMDALRDSE